ncbi:hypothetical protein BYT27DRAFT_7341276 [Phlegmacium glaucopus]|nr:hypothetical protein BYT27DRAFT_7341276 [Phlegmacium glaucopus]
MAGATSGSKIPAVIPSPAPSMSSTWASAPALSPPAAPASTPVSRTWALIAFYEMRDEDGARNAKHRYAGTNSCLVQQLLASQASTMHSTPMQHMYSSLYCVGPSRNQYSRDHQTEAHRANITIHESSRTITRDRSTSTHPGIAWMVAVDSGAGEARRPPSSNPPIVDCNPTVQQRWRKPYDRNRPHRGLANRPNNRWFSNPITGTIDIGTISTTSVSTCCAGLNTSATSASTALSDMPNEDAATNANTNMQEQPAEEDDRTMRCLEDLCFFFSFCIYQPWMIFFFLLLLICHSSS